MLQNQTRRNRKIDIRDIRIRFHAYPICFHPTGWEPEGNRKTDIRIHLHAYPIVSIFMHGETWRTVPYEIKSSKVFSRKVT